MIFITIMNAVLLLGSVTVVLDNLSTPFKLVLEGILLFFVFTKSSVLEAEIKVGSLATIKMRSVFQEDKKQEDGASVEKARNCSNNVEFHDQKFSELSATLKKAVWLGKGLRLGKH